MGIDSAVVVGIARDLDIYFRLENTAEHTSAGALIDCLSCEAATHSDRAYISHGLRGIALELSLSVCFTLIALYPCCMDKK